MQRYNYRVLGVRVCGCNCVCVCVCDSADKFDIGHCQTKVKVTAGVQTVFPFTAIQTVRSYNSTLVQARKLILSMYVHLILVYNIYEYHHA